METESNNSNWQAPRWVLGIILAVAIVAVVAYAWQRKTVRTLADQNQRVTASLQQTQTQLDALKSKIDELSAPPAQAPSAAKPAAATGVPHHRGSARATAGHRARSADDPRWKQFQSKLDEQGKQIDATRQDLSSTRTELQGSIARTHDELVVLERKGERSYFEFDLNKAKQFRQTGPVGIRLKKANTKHSFADLELMVDDVDLSKKHVNLYEPVTFYNSEDGRPVELVINSISKDHIHGYVATPKYSKNDLAAMGANGTGVDATQPQQRQKLELPKN